MEQNLGQNLGQNLKNVFLNELSQLSIHELMEISHYIENNNDHAIREFHENHKLNFEGTNKIVNEMTPEEYNYYVVNFKGTNDIVNEMTHQQYNNLATLSRSAVTVLSDKPDPENNPVSANKPVPLDAEKFRKNVETSAKNEVTSKLTPSSQITNVEKFKQYITNIASDLVQEEFGKVMSTLANINNKDMNHIYPTKIGGNNFKNFFNTNPEYNIYDPPGDGDCFFYVAEEALKATAHEKSLQQLREIVAENMDADKFDIGYVTGYIGDYEGIIQRYKNIRDSLLNVYENKTDFSDEDENNMHNLHEKLDDARLLIDEGPIPKFMKIIFGEHYLNLIIKKIYDDENNDDIYQIIQNIKVSKLNDFKEYIKIDSERQNTNNISNIYGLFWADDNSIGILEKELNVKFIIFNENNDITLVYCRQTENKRDNNTMFILSSYDGRNAASGHYRLITHQNKKIFTFDELPDEIKTQYNSDCNNEL